jgi:hypothetical protein
VHLDQEVELDQIEVDLEIGQEIDQVIGQDMEVMGKVEEHKVKEGIGVEVAIQQVVEGVEGVYIVIDIIRLICIIRIWIMMIGIEVEKIVEVGIKIGIGIKVEIEIKTLIGT